MPKIAIRGRRLNSFRFGRCMGNRPPRGGHRCGGRSRPHRCILPRSCPPLRKTGEPVPTGSNRSPGYGKRSWWRIPKRRPWQRPSSCRRPPDPGRGSRNSLPYSSSPRPGEEIETGTGKRAEFPFLRERRVASGRGAFASLRYPEGKSRSLRQPSRLLWLRSPGGRRQAQGRKLLKITGKETGAGTKSKGVGECPREAGG
jgi:hypothetical protein